MRNNQLIMNDGLLKNIEIKLIHYYYFMISVIATTCVYEFCGLITASKDMKEKT